MSLTWSFNHALLTFLLWVLTFTHLLSFLRSLNAIILCSHVYLGKYLVITDNRGMSKIILTPAQRKVHRAEAHHLSPVVMIGNDGLSAAVKKETNAALNSHGLIKIRVLGDDRVVREAMYQTLAEELSAAPIQHIGKLLVLWRPILEIKKERSEDDDRMAGPRDFKVLKYSSRGGQRPEVKTLRVLGNQRLTQGGKVKRAQPKQTSVKKRSQT